MLDDQGRIEYVNDPAVEMLGRRPSAGALFLDHVRASHRQRMAVLLEDVLTKGETVHKHPVCLVGPGEGER
ncbi:MAG: hypothetical protein J7M26_03510 [Armatimonadetes bacterium]|nr:hypothetical protein [Armatimonadota bacterium]